MIQFYMVKYSKVANARCYAMELPEKGIFYINL